MRLSELMVFHGSPKKVQGILKIPLFVTTARHGAEEFAYNPDGKGTILTGQLHVNTPLEIDTKPGLKRLMKIASDLGIKCENSDYPGDFWCDALEDYGSNNPQNPFDLVYIPGMIEAIKKAGYDSLHGHDLLAMTMIDTYVLFDPKQFEIQTA